MKVYLVQHAEAMSEEQNPERPLTELGRQHTRSVADLAARMGVEVEQVRHSGKTRAEQTAEILGEALGPGAVPLSRWRSVYGAKPAVSSNRGTPGEGW